MQSFFMSPKAKQLFKEFDKVSEQDWIAKIEKDLKGKPLSILNYNPEKELKTKAYFHSDNATLYPPIEGSENNVWFVQELFEGNDNKKLNTIILDHLLKGVDGIQLKVNDKTNLKDVLKDVGLQYVSTELLIQTKNNWQQIKELLKTDYNNFSMSFNVLTLGTTKGKFDYNLDDFYEFYQKFKENKNLKNIHVDGLTFGFAGASSVQEMAIALTQLSEYTQYLLNKGVKLNDIINQTYTTLSVNEEYFTNIAKFRAYKLLIRHFFKSFDEQIEIDKVHINAVTNKRHIAKNDRYNNLLRATTQAMSAILGGVNNIQVTPFDTTDEISVRMARNIQLVLKEEAYFDKVSDPAAGAYYIEDLTDQLVEQTWRLFLEIEENGGYITSLTDNNIQTKINENKQLLVEQLNAGKKTFLGVNKYPSTLEQWIDVEPKDIKGQAFEPLQEFILEQHYQKPTEQ